MFKKIAAVINHPYLAPLTETLKGIYRIARAPVNGFVEDAVEGWKEGDNDGEGAAHMQNMYASLYDSLNTGTSFTALGGSLFGGLAFASGGAMLMGGAGIGMTILGGVMGLGIGVAAGPFIIAGVMATAAAAVGIVIGGVPGFIKGIGKIIEYQRDRKGYELAMKKLAGVDATQDNAKELASLVGKFNALSHDKQEVAVRMLNEEFGRGTWDYTEKIIGIIDTMPAASRTKLAAILKEKLASEFAPVAEAPPVVTEKPAPDNAPIVAPPMASFRPRKRSMKAVP